VEIKNEMDVERLLSSGHTAPRSMGLGLRGYPILTQPKVFLLDTRLGLCVLLGLTFLANYVETGIESWTAENFGVASGPGHLLAETAHWLEGSYVFENHDHTNVIAIYGFSTMYYILFPVIALYCLFAAARKADISVFRMMALSPVFAYLLHLPFFLFFPVPERWAFPNSGAILLSDLWSTPRPIQP